MDKIGSNRIAKIGVIVDNIEEAVKYYSELFQIEKPKIIYAKGGSRGEASDGGRTPYITYRGEPGSIDLKVAIIPLEPIYIELIEPSEVPSPWGEYKDKHGPGVGFVSFYVDGFEDHVKLLDKMGMPAYYYQEKGKERYSYFDTQDKLGITLELKEFDKE